jgi:ATP-dependent helicase HrpB
MDPKSLPIYEVEIELLQALKKHKRLIIQAPTGSGKSTQVPQILLDRGLAGDGEIVVLQPRRLAARMLARRVAAERLGTPGEEIGYQVRFENKTSARTRVRFVTEGILLREFLSNPLLEGISTVIFDEFHERHLYADISLARALIMQQTMKPDLQIVVMSATLDRERLEPYLAPCEVVHTQGRTFPVDIRHLERKVDFEKSPVWQAAASAFASAITAGAEGDVLVFMPGAYEITRTVEAIKSNRASSGFDVMPLHGALPVEQQDAAVLPGPRRKVVVATNVAETSLTIEGICLVIDSGLARIARYDANKGIDQLHIEGISRASADQRAGRAGRTAPGQCIRLWTIHEHEKRPAQETPEIARTDLSEIVLMLKAGGVDDLGAFPWVEAPESRVLSWTTRLLYDLGALDKEEKLTRTGQRMLAFPLHPRYARMLMVAHEYGCVREAALIAALVQGRSILIRKVSRDTEIIREKTFGDQELSDFITLIQAWHYADHKKYQVEACRDLGIHANGARQVGELYRHFLRIAQREGLDTRHPNPDHESICKCILAGFSDNLAVRRGKGTLRCALVHGRSADLSKESVVQGAMILVAGEIRNIQKASGKTQTFIGQATAVQETWLRELFPGDFEEGSVTRYDASNKRVVTETVRRFRDLDLERKAGGEVDENVAARLLAEEVLAGRLPLPGWNAEVEKWITRVNCLSAWQPDWKIPVIGEEDRVLLLEQVCLGCVSKKDLKNREVWPVLKDWLNPAQQALIDAEAPERLLLPGGRRAKITYAVGAAPELAATIQDLYDLHETPRIAGGVVPLRISILAPNRRPVQVTEDLASFWRDRYPAVKKEMQKKYYKHEWR